MEDELAKGLGHLFHERLQLAFKIIGKTTSDAFG